MEIRINKFAAFGDGLLNSHGPERVWGDKSTELHQEVWRAVFTCYAEKDRHHRKWQVTSKFPSLVPGASLP